MKTKRIFILMAWYVVFSGLILAQKEYTIYIYAHVEPKDHSKFQIYATTHQTSFKKDTCNGYIHQQISHQFKWCYLKINNYMWVHPSLTKWIKEQSVDPELEQADIYKVFISKSDFKETLYGHYILKFTGRLWLKKIHRLTLRYCNGNVRKPPVYLITKITQLKYLKTHEM